MTWCRPVFTSGDCSFTDVLWDKMRILPTDPGAAFSHIWPALMRLPQILTALASHCSEESVKLQIVPA